MAKDGLFFKQATELNKNQVPAKALWVQCIWACVYFGKVRGFINVRNFCIVVVSTILAYLFLEKKRT
jgi:APA family basic amino acid/polyamine antiporter